MRIEFDTPVDERYPIYTRANAGEVLPGIASPLGWTLVGPAMEEGFRRSLCRDCGAVRWPGDRPYRFVGRFAGRFHLNLSVLREAGEHLPGTSAAAVDEQYFGDPDSLGLPAHQSTAWDRLWVVRSSPATVRTMLTLGRRIRRQSATTAELVADNRRFVAGGPGDAAVVARLLRLRQEFADRFATHITARALTSSAVSLLTRAVHRAGGPSDLPLRLLTGLPMLESSQPSLTLRRLAARVGPDTELGRAVAGGLSFDELQRSELPGSGELRTGLRHFLLTFGHRGLNEFEPTWPAWEQDPEPVLRLLSAVLRAHDDVEAGAAAGRRAAVAELARLGAMAPALQALAANARTAVVRGETTKSNAIKASHEMRRLIWLLRDRWTDRLPPDHLALLSIDELSDVADGAPVPIDALRRRDAELHMAGEVDVPEVLVGEARTVPRGGGAAQHLSQLDGIGGSPGSATGPARVIEGPGEHFDDGDVLVTAVTDTAWTPLFLAAAAVVTDVGGVLSHATIVARDLGIPAVVNTKHATREIRTGDLLEVDGTTGVVHILERSAS